jgi:hypothetical protein
MVIVTATSAETFGVRSYNFFKQTIVCTAAYKTSRK